MRTLGLQGAWLDLRLDLSRGAGRALAMAKQALAVACDLVPRTAWNCIGHD